MESATLTTQSFCARVADDLVGARLPFFGRLGIVVWELVFVGVPAAVGTVAPSDGGILERAGWALALGIVGALIGVIALYLVLLPVAIWRQRNEARAWIKELEAAKPLWVDVRDFCGYQDPAGNTYIWLLHHLAVANRSKVDPVELDALLLLGNTEIPAVNYDAAGDIAPENLIAPLEDRLSVPFHISAQGGVSGTLGFVYRWPDRVSRNRLLQERNILVLRDRLTHVEHEVHLPPKVYSVASQGALNIEALAAPRPHPLTRLWSHITGRR